MDGSLGMVEVCGKGAEKEVQACTSVYLGLLPDMLTC